MVFPANLWHNLNMGKDFKKWHQHKEYIHHKRPRIFFHEREVWFAYIGVNIGFEQDGQGDKFLRSVVIIKKFNNEVAWCVPLTKARKEGKYYFKFSFKIGEQSVAIISQVRLINAKRLLYKIGDISESDFSTLKKKIRQLIA